jgi:hypothetical protein
MVSIVSSLLTTLAIQFMWIVAPYLPDQLTNDEVRGTSHYEIDSPLKVWYNE